VSWEDAQAYVRWLNTMTTGGYRLLSESEWEYAARAGTTSPYPWGSDSAQACVYANGSDATFHPVYPSLGVLPCNDGALYTAPVGSYRPNAFGLNDMIGNVWDWVEDCYAASLSHVPANGSAYEASHCSARVDRGGSWYDGRRGLRSAIRDDHSPLLRYSDIGIRVAKTLE
jgi:formylglycine-generating enzyme required for sulfatase activity